jgi:hypothetical protein
MKTDVYDVTIREQGIYHERYHFVGRVPTKKELLEAIERRLDGSLVCDNINDAYSSRTIVREVGIPEIGTLNGKVWKVLGSEIGSVTVEHVDAWTLETS